MNNDIIVFALTSSIELADEICEHLNVERGKIKVEHFSDGEIIVEPEQSVRGKHVFIVQSTNNPTSSTIMEVLIALDACKRASCDEITVVMPYFGYARQDRKSRGREPITARLVTDILATAGADRIVTIDLHSGQTQGFFDGPFDHLVAGPAIENYIRENFKDFIMVSPDAGSAVALCGAPLIRVMTGLPSDSGRPPSTAPPRD